MHKRFERVSNLCTTCQTLESGKQHNSALHIILRELLIIVQNQDSQIQKLESRIGSTNRPTLKR